jgi:hypothetical protein
MIHFEGRNVDRAWGLLLQEAEWALLLGTLSTASHLVTTRARLKDRSYLVSIELDQDESHSWSSSSPALDRPPDLS